MFKLKSEEFENPKFTDQNLPKFLSAEKQKTINGNIVIEGIGLHTGNKTSMSLNSAPINTGYVFRLKKNGKLFSIKASYKNVKSTKLCTLISDSLGNTISTIEHILSALYAFNIDNIYIDLDSNEVLYATVHQKSLLFY